MKSKKLEKLFQSLRNRKFLVVEPSGNYGDSLIFMGAYKLLGSLSIRYQKVSAQDFFSFDKAGFDVIYIHGGGGFNELWKAGTIESFEKAILDFPGIVILGPQTFMESILKYSNRLKDIIQNRKAESIFVFTRELLSYEMFKSICPLAINLDHDHDTALNLTSEDFNADVFAKGAFYAIRSDKEGAGFSKPHPFLLWLDPIVFCETFDEWVALHARFKMVVTNRLHSAILSSILGKTIVLLPNSYHKNRAVWEYSLKQKKVEWRDKLEFHPLFSVLSRNAIYNKVCSSYKIGQFLRWVNGIRHSSKSVVF